MTTIVTRAAKGSALSWNEVDANFTNLNTAKLELNASGNLGIGTSSPNATYKLTLQGDGSSVIGGFTLRNGATEYLFVGNPTVGNTTDAEIWNPQNGFIRFATNNTERARIDSAGNLLVNGTVSSTASKLQVRSSYAAGSFFSGLTTLPSDGGSGGLTMGAISSNNSQIVCGSEYYSAGQNYSYSTTSSQISFVGADVIFYTNSGLTAGTLFTPTERARIDSSGNLLVGTTSTTIPTSSSSLIYLQSTGAMYVGHANGSSGGTAYSAFAYNGSVIGSITQDGTTGVLYNTSSDARLKHDIVDAPEASSLIDAIKVRSFKWNADNSEQRYGMVAQELLEVAPEAVSVPADEDQMMGVDYSKLVPMLVKEIQSLRTRVAQLEGN